MDTFRIARLGKVATALHWNFADIHLTHETELDLRECVLTGRQPSCRFKPRVEPRRKAGVCNVPKVVAIQFAMWVDQDPRLDHVRMLYLYGRQTAEGPLRYPTLIASVPLNRGKRTGVYRRGMVEGWENGVAW